MGTRAEPVDKTRLRQALVEVRSDNGDVYRKSWLAVGHVEQNPQLIDLVEMNVSSSSLEELYPYLKDDEVVYCLLRLTTTFDMSTTVKFVYIHW